MKLPATTSPNPGNVMLRKWYDHRPGQRAAILDEWDYGGARLQVLTSTDMSAAWKPGTDTYSIRATHGRDTVTVGTGLPRERALAIIDEFQRALTEDMP